MFATPQAHYNGCYYGPQTTYPTAVTDGHYLRWQQQWELWHAANWQRQLVAWGWHHQQHPFARPPDAAAPCNSADEGHGDDGGEQWQGEGEEEEEFSERERCFASLPVYHAPTHGADDTGLDPYGCCDQAAVAADAAAGGPLPPGVARRARRAKRRFRAAIAAASVAEARAESAAVVAALRAQEAESAASPLQPFTPAEVAREAARTARKRAKTAIRRCLVARVGLALLRWLLPEQGEAAEEEGEVEEGGAEKDEHEPEEGGAGPQDEGGGHCAAAASESAGGNATMTTERRRARAARLNALCAPAAQQLGDFFEAEVCARRSQKASALPDAAAFARLEETFAQLTLAMPLIRPASLRWRHLHSQYQYRGCCANGTTAAAAVTAAAAASAAAAGRPPALAPLPAAWRASTPLCTFALDLLRSVTGEPEEGTVFVQLAELLENLNVGASGGDPRLGAHLRVEDAFRTQNWRSNCLSAQERRTMRAFEDGGDER